MKDESLILKIFLAITLILILTGIFNLRFQRVSLDSVTETNDLGHSYRTEPFSQDVTYVKTGYVGNGMYILNCIYMCICLIVSIPYMIVKRSKKNIILGIINIVLLICFLPIVYTYTFNNGEVVSYDPYTFLFCCIMSL